MNVLDQLRRDEGEVLHAYQDSLGFWTIGVGHLIDSRRGGGISKAASDFLLQEDVSRVRDALHTHLDWFEKLDDVRQGVLVNLGFALGIEGLLRFHQMLTFLETALDAVKWTTPPTFDSRALESAASELLNSKWASQVGDRVKRLAEQLRTGEWK